MNSPSNRMLQALQLAVAAQRAVHETLNDLEDAITSNGLNEAQQELLAEEVTDLALGDPLIDGLIDRPVSREDLESILRALAAEAP
jgi:hypothetical protein